MSETLFAMGVDQAAQQKIGGETYTNAWLDTAGGGANVIGRGTDNSVSICFATSGSWESPGGWTDVVDLDTTDTNVPASDLQDAIDAGITAPSNLGGVEVIVIKSVYSSGNGKFDAKIGSNYDEDWYVMS